MGLVLAGGRGRRLGGRDKGLLRHRDQPLAVGALRLLRPHVGTLVISANRNWSRYARLADLVVADAAADFRGPLAGISAAMHATRGRWLVVCPCDAVATPLDLPARLLRALRLDERIDAAVARDAWGRQPLFAALRWRSRSGIDAYLRSGERSVHGWLASVRVVEVRVSGRLGNYNVRPA